VVPELPKIPEQACHSRTRPLPLHSPAVGRPSTKQAIRKAGRNPSKHQAGKQSSTELLKAELLKHRTAHAPAQAHRRTAVSCRTTRTAAAPQPRLRTGACAAVRPCTHARCGGVPVPLTPSGGQVLGLRPSRCHRPPPRRPAAPRAATAHGPGGHRPPAPHTATAQDLAWVLRLRMRPAAQDLAPPPATMPPHPASAPPLPAQVQPAGDQDQARIPFPYSLLFPVLDMEEADVEPQALNLVLFLFNFFI
jgi:hypothetical protein